jgi:hypothetical protein
MRNFKCPECGQMNYLGNVVPFMISEATGETNETHAQYFDGEKWYDVCPGIGKLVEVPDGSL